jgi:hypothetical protein
MVSKLDEVRVLAMKDGRFRSRLLADPVLAVKQARIKLSKSDMDTLRSSITRLKDSKTTKELDEIFRTGALGW